MLAAIFIITLWLAAVLLAQAQSIQSYIKQLSYRMALWNTGIMSQEAFYWSRMSLLQLVFAVSRQRKTSKNTAANDSNTNRCFLCCCFRVVNLLYPSTRVYVVRCMFCDYFAEKWQFKSNKSLKSTHSYNNHFEHCSQENCDKYQMNETVIIV